MTIAAVRRSSGDYLLADARAEERLGVVRLLPEDLERDVAGGLEVVDRDDVRAGHEVHRARLLRGSGLRPVVVDDRRAVDLEDRAVVGDEAEVIVGGGGDDERRSRWSVFECG